MTHSRVMFDFDPYLPWRNDSRDFLLSVPDPIIHAIVDSKYSPEKCLVGLTSSFNH